MLIKTSEHSLGGKHKWKSEFWEKCAYTPNEAYEQIREYRKYVQGFAAHNRYPKPHKFFQVRIVKQKPSVLYTATKNWWDDAGFMDHIFWVFQKPVYDRLDNDFFQYYALEPKESARVYARLMELGGQLQPSMNGFVVPCECVELAWTETSAGISDHLHYRPEKVHTQEEIDARKKLDEDALAILDNSWDITGKGDEWEGTSERVRQNIRKRLSS